MSPSPQVLPGWRPVEAGSPRDQAIFECEAAIHFLAAERFDQFTLGHSGAGAGDDREHGIDDQIAGHSQAFQFLRRLDGAKAFERQLRFDELHFGQSLAKRALGVGRQESPLDPDPLHFWRKRRQSLDCNLYPVGARACGWAECRDPEPIELPLVTLHRMPDIGRAFRMAFHAEEDRQVAADASFPLSCRIASCRGSCDAASSQGGVAHVSLSIANVAAIRPNAAAFGCSRGDPEDDLCRLRAKSTRRGALADRSFQPKHGLDQLFPRRITKPDLGGEHHQFTIPTIAARAIGLDTPAPLATHYAQFKPAAQAGLVILDLGQQVIARGDHGANDVFGRVRRRA